nr:tyrosine-type recombinase/integrase [Lysinibacillus cavernae]
MILNNYGLVSNPYKDEWTHTYFTDISSDDGYWNIWLEKKSINRIKKSIHPHQLRHSFATHMINNGAPIDVIQSLLGHEKSETTKIYAQLSGKLRQDLYSKNF